MYTLKIECKEAGFSCNINQAFGQGTISKWTTQYRKIHDEDESLEDEKSRGCPATDVNQLRPIIKPKTSWEIAKELNVNSSTIVWHLH